MSWALDKESETFKIYSRLDTASAFCLERAIKPIQGYPVLCLTVLKRQKFTMCLDYLILCHIWHQHYFQPQKNRKYNGLDLQLPLLPRHSLNIAPSSCSYHRIRGLFHLEKIFKILESNLCLGTPCLYVHKGKSSFMDRRQSSARVHAGQQHADFRAKLGQV